MLKNGKVAGPDGVPVEALKVVMATTARLDLEDLPDKGEVTDEWKESLF